jgi:2-hydroxychromene-2-carboxylate isomerase
VTVTAEFIFDFGSPNAYLAHRVLPQIEARTGVRFTYLPALLGGIFKATGNVSPAVSLQGIKNKPEYQRLEMQRFLTKHGITDFQMNPHFPVNTLALMRGALVAEREGILAEYVDAGYHHMWVEPKKLDDPEILRAALGGSGLPVAALMEAMADPDIKRQLIENTDAAVARGVFGSPSFFVGDEHYFGKDRLDEVEAEIERTKGNA